MKTKKTVEDYLREVNYQEMGRTYLPSEFSIQYINFIKMVNAGKEDIQASPPMHYKMADAFISKKTRIANLCFRGSGKALSLDTRILTPTGYTTMGNIKVGDTVIDRYGEETKVIFVSEEFRNKCYKFTLEDGTSFIANEDHQHIASGFDNIERTVTTKDILRIGVTSWVNGARIPRWKIPLCRAVKYSKKDFKIDPYTLGILLGDRTKIGRIDIYRRCNINYSDRCFKEVVPEGNNINRKSIPECYFFGSISQRLSLLKGLMDSSGYTDGKNGYVFYNPSKSLVEGFCRLVRGLGGFAKINSSTDEYGLFKVAFKINEYVYGDNRETNVDKKTTNTIVSVTPIDGEVVSKCIQVSSRSKSYLIEENVVTHNTSVFAEYLVLYVSIFNTLPNLGKCNVIMYVADSMENGGKSFRMNVETRYLQSSFLQEYLPEAKFTNEELIFTNKEGKSTYVKIFGCKSGVRGFKREGDRPVLAIIDDIVSNEDANSKLQLDKMKDTIYKDIDNALNPMRNKIIFNGTPFNKSDPIYEAVESGAWETNVYPVCSRFPCTREEFDGAWEERFNYDAILRKYEDYVKLGKVKAFNQELMLRITSDEDRVINDDDIKWFNRTEFLQERQRYNFYITTDFATSTNKRADYTAIGVWAVDAKENRYLVDGILGRFLMNETFEHIFKYCTEYQIESVGLEVTGQQGGFVSLFKEEMLKRNIFFSIARMKGTKKEGIAVKSNKMDRFRLSEPFFKRGKVYFPKEMENSSLVVELIEELRTVTIDGIKAMHDDAIDMLSQLDQMVVVYPSKFQDASKSQDSFSPYSTVSEENQFNSIEDYLA